VTDFWQKALASDPDPGYIPACRCGASAPRKGSVVPIQCSLTSSFIVVKGCAGGALLLVHLGEVGISCLLDGGY
jgi:hypothetical protein